MYILGQFGQRASVIKFDKSNAEVDWKLEIKTTDSTKAAPNSEMNEILSYAQSAKDYQWIYGCGYRWVDPAQETYSNAVTMKVSTQGDLQFVDVWGYDKLDQRDLCRAAAYDEQREVVVFLMEVSSSYFRPQFDQIKAYSESNNDLLIVRMDPGGTFKGATNINYAAASIDFLVGGHSFFIHEGLYYFGSYSYGFHTNVQNKTYNIQTPTYDTHLFRYDPETNLQCFHQEDISAAALTGTTGYHMRHKYSAAADLTQVRDLLKKVNNLYLAWPSKYSGSFELLDSLRYPKMCADFSYNMTDGVQYYRGQKEKEYIIGKSSKGSEGVNMMDDGGIWIFQNGSIADGLLGRWEKNIQSGAIYVQTDSPEAEGTQHTILRGCSRYDKLSELYLYVKVIKNSYPDFETEIETSWELWVG